MAVTIRMLPAKVIVSGLRTRRDECLRALRDAGFEAVRPPGDPRWDEAHGLPSHPSVELAADAGKPNSGHTPGSPHPETGQPYESDPAIAWLTIESDQLDAVVSAAGRAGWRLRMHTAPSRHRFEELTVEERLARIESDLAAVRGAR